MAWMSGYRLTRQDNITIRHQYLWTFCGNPTDSYFAHILEYTAKFGSLYAETKWIIILELFILLESSQSYSELPYVNPS